MSRYNNPTNEERRAAWVAFVAGALTPSETPMIDAERLLKEFDRRFTLEDCATCFGNGTVWVNHAGGGGGHHTCHACKGTGAKGVR